MAETSRSRVTITLGRSGQVVKRAGPVLDSAFSDSHPAVGSKRSVRDRLGNDVSGTQLTQLNNKRQRGDSAANGVNDMRLGKDDLRFKLMQKNGFRRVQSDDQNEADLRNTLSRAVRPSSTSLISTRQRMPEPNDARQRMPEPKDASRLGRIPSTRSADALPQMDSLRNSYSPWTLDHLRRRSPDGVLGTSTGLSPRRMEEELPKRPLIRTYDDVRSRTVSYISKDILEPSRPMGTASFMTKPIVPAGSVKSVAPLLAPPPPPSGIVQKSSYTGSEHLTMDGFMQSLGLEKYAIYLKAEEVDMTVLRQMGDNDLKELGIPMGPRKKILLALQPRSRRPL
uniref:Putative Sterile alpha motif domain-containing protein isoform 1 n=1 Tax=Davidia involucrata TaxID=16924 RepID=A0A5B7ALB0_DAVIN